MATTDVHMQLVGHDYTADRTLTHNGLAGLATLITRARAEAAMTGRRCVLFDNGDMLQGGAMGEALARRPVTPEHPIVRTLNRIGYDAIGLGNHDFDFGLNYITDLADALRMPLLCTNLQSRDKMAWRASAIIDCPAPPGQTPSVPLRIGVLSVLPTLTRIWNREALKDRAQVVPAYASLARAIPRLRDAGADIVILLAHMGLDEAPEELDTQQETALHLAELPGIDAIVAGHTHRRFPGFDHRDRAGLDATRGTLACRPAIMPGYGASDLAVLDLTLCREDSRWRVAAHRATLRRNTKDVPAEPGVTTICAAIHAETLRAQSRIVGRTPRPLHNYFALAKPTQTAALVARAKTRAILRALAGTPDAGMPVIAAVSTHTAGGREGPHNYLHMPRGPVLRRHLSGLSPYVNEIWALRITGAQLLAWLEQSAVIFTTLRQDRPNQPLTNPTIPAFNFDTIFGIRYGIDPTRSPGKRIKALTHDGIPVTGDQAFIVATNQFRAAGGGGFAAHPPSSIVLRSPIGIHEALEEVLSTPHDDEAPLPWHFAPATPVDAVLETSPHAVDWLDDIAHLEPKVLGCSETGFLRVGLRLQGLPKGRPDPI